jgi:predicted porin
MKKSLAALAVLGACAGTAHAQSSVQIYGTVDAGLIKRTEQTLAIGKRANNTLGFKGAEDLGDGLKALFQLEIRYEPDNGFIEQGAGGVQRPLFQGQSRVGLQGAFGIVRFGRALTPFQEVSTQFEPFHGLPTPVGFQTDLAVAGYTSAPLDPVGNSTNRFSNALWYTSPEVNGFQLVSAIGTKEANSGAALIGRGSAAAPQYGANAEGSVNPYSAVVTYRQGPAALMLAAERNAVETKLWSIAGALTPMPELKLMLSWQRQDQDHTRLSNPKTKAWVLGGHYIIGVGKLIVGYGQKTPDGLEKTKQGSIGYEYSLSKRTYLYFDGSEKKAPTQTPNNIRTLAVGINHAF